MTDGGIKTSKTLYGYADEYVYHILMAYICVLSLYYKNYKCVNIEGSVTVAMVSHRGRESVKFQFLRRL